MDRRISRWLTALYPPGWRARYAEEFAALLEERPITVRDSVNVIAWALYERATCPGGFGMQPRQYSLVMITWAYLAAVAAGVNFYFSVDDTPLAHAMGDHLALSASFGLVAKASFLALIVVIALAVPIASRMVQVARATQRWDTIRRLAVPFGATAATITWIVVVGMWARSQWGGFWVPLPWDVGGNWNAPSNWPPLSVRLPFSAVTLALLVAGLLGSGVSVGQAIARTDLSRLPPLLLKVATASLAGLIVVMALGVTAWGFFAERYVSADFHIRNGGLFLSTNFLSWAASLVVFAGSAFIAVRSARLAITGHEQTL